MTLEEFNAAAAEEATAVLLACCDAPAWADAVREQRPYADVPAALAAADAASRALGADEVERALAAHPRIGERAPGAGTEAGWSRQEQSGVSTDEATQRAVVAANRDYEERFGRVFLICATGLSAADVLAAARARLEHDDATEAGVVAEELRRIAALRLGKALAPVGQGG